MSEECIFCKIAKGDIPADKILETETLLAFKDVNPVAPTHVLIIPREHISTLNHVKSEKSGIAGEMLMAAKEVAQKTGVAETGYRTIINTNRQAGQEIFHLHMHVIGGRPLEKMG
ncbi:MAG: histidine triad nucleotide-binding protein [Proteobacteria bacterium]|nr:histidine triad nucleotide-binding protein [Pseudomonadota bacterium]